MSLPRHVTNFPTFIDIQKYIRKLSIQRYFLSLPPRTTPPINDGHIHMGLSNPPLFNPPGTMAPAISVFRSLVLRDLDLLPSKKTYLDPNIKKGLKSLCEQKNLIIRPADKGGTIVILNKEDYITKMNEILGDSSTYSLIQSDPTATFKRSLTLLVNEGYSLGILNKKEELSCAPSTSDPHHILPSEGTQRSGRSFNAFLFEGYWCDYPVIGVY